MSRIKLASLGARWHALNEGKGVAEFRCARQDAGFEEGATKDELGKAMKDHIVAQGQLMGTYSAK